MYSLTWSPPLSIHSLCRSREYFNAFKLVSTVPCTTHQSHTWAHRRSEVSVRMEHFEAFAYLHSALTYHIVKKWTIRCWVSDLTISDLGAFRHRGFYRKKISPILRPPRSHKISAYHISTKSCNARLMIVKEFFPALFSGVEGGRSHSPIFQWLGVSCIKLGRTYDSHCPSNSTFRFPIH